MGLFVKKRVIYPGRLIVSLMNASEAVLLVVVLLIAGIVFLLVAIPGGLVLWFLVTTPTNTTITTMPTTTIISDTLTINPVGGAECNFGEYCDVQVAQASGGQPPYSYQSDSYATGTPPMGMIVDLNGHLTGTPTKEGGYRFGVCVADATRDSECTQAEATVTKEKARSEAEITSFICTYKYKDSYGDKHYELKASGKAAGPEGAELQIVFNPGYFTKPNSGCPECKAICSSWGASQLQTCARGSGPETTTWTAYVPASQVMSGATLGVAGYEVELRARIFEGGAATAEDVRYATCPN
jgi:hypothetical protein